MTGKQQESRAVPTVCLIDGTALAYRSHYAFIRRPLTNSSGTEVSALFGFADKLLSLLEELEPDYVAVAFDTAEPTFRHETYEDYKATREGPPDVMIEQLPAIAEFVELLGVRVLELPGYEADDVIGTLALRAHGRGMEVVIAAGDKDFFQLVRDGITVLDPYKKVEYTPDVVREKFGVSPEKVVEVLGLMGDASDNVPGVPGIGKKTALDLIGKYGTLEDVLSNTGEISGPKRRQNLEEHADDARLSRELVTIDPDAPVGVEVEDLERGRVDVEGAAEFLREWELPSLLDRVIPRGGDGKTTYRMVTSERELAELAELLSSSGGFVVDLETTSLDPLSAEIVGIAVAADDETAWYVPVGHASGRGIEREKALEKLAPLLADESVPKVGQNLKFDCEVLSHSGVDLSPIHFDTMVASYLLDPNRRQHGLGALALEHLNRRVVPIEDLIGKGRSQITFDEVSAEAARDYACEDAEVTFKLWKRLRPAVEEAGLLDLLRDVEQPLIPILAAMELKGVRLDTGVLDDLSEEFGGDIEGLRSRVWELSGSEFNLDSPRQVANVLFERLGLPKGRRTKTGYSTDTRVLERLCDVHEVPRLLLEYRKLMKLKAGYLDALPRLVHPETGRVHTSFNQTVVSTGRLSSSDPNLQNIPMRTKLGRKIREAFVADEGKVLLSADYSQIELRIMAHLSGDENLRDAFERGLDFHRATAALIFGKEESDVEPGERDWAKTVNFGIMYGMSQYGLSRQLGIPVEDAAVFIEKYFDTYPRVREYTDRIVAEAEETGCVRTMLGRRRPISGLSADNSMASALARRAAVNTPIQGSAADLIKVAMIGVERRIREERLPCDMVLQVHDELVFEVDSGRVEDVERAVRDEMEHPRGFDLSVPVVVNFGRGVNWLEAH
ncbi:MAG: DNA polymerase I [Candidatus Eisenbacteria bacterium]|nr:DNA polymerase I [Candidatus Eisenbacteria bacterium]